METEAQMLETERIESYLELLNSIVTRGVDMSAAIAVLHETAKDSRVERMRQERLLNKNGLLTADLVGNSNERASERQLAYIRDLGSKTRKNMTREQASKKIDELLAAQGA